MIGSPVGKDGIEPFTEYFKKELKCRVQYLGEFNNNKKNHVVFRLHSNDVTNFNMKRTTIDAYTVEEFLDEAEAQGTADTYPSNLKKFRMWT
jgi:hypothetical protein